MAVINHLLEIDAFFYVEPPNTRMYPGLHLLRLQKYNKHALKDATQGAYSKNFPNV